MPGVSTPNGNERIVWKEISRNEESPCNNQLYCMLHQPSGINCKESEPIWAHRSRVSETKTIHIRN